MTNKKLQSDRDRKMMEMAHAYEMAKAAHQHIYLDAEDFADLAEWYARHNDFVRADEVMQYALSLHPGNTDLLVEQAYERLDREDREGARQILQQIEEEGDDVTILRARLLLEYGREDDAELELDTLEYKYSQNNIIDVVYMYIETNHADKAGEWLEHWRWSTDNVDYCAAMADYLSAIGKFQQAIIYFNKLIDSNPYSPSYWYGLGRCYFELRQYDKAIDACEYALVSDAEYGDAYMLKGYAYSMLHNSGKAQENYEKAIQYNSMSQSFVHILMGINKLEACEWAEAYEHLDKVIRGEKDGNLLNSFIYSDAALCLKYLDLEKCATLIIQYCDKALQVDRFNLDAYLLKGLAYSSHGNEEQCIATWEEAVKLMPEADTWMAISYYGVEAGLFDYALKALHNVEKLDPSYPDLNERLTIIYLLLKDTGKADYYNRISQDSLPQSTMDGVRQMLKDCSKDECIQLLKEHLNKFGGSHNPVI